MRWTEKVEAQRVGLEDRAVCEFCRNVGKQDGFGRLCGYVTARMTNDVWLTVEILTTDLAG